MGLETGWNCHISLQSESFPLDPDNVDDPVVEEGEKERCIRLLEFLELLHFIKFGRDYFFC